MQTQWASFTIYPGHWNSQHLLMRSARLKQSRKWEYLWKDECEGHNVDLQQLLKNLKWILIFSNIGLDIKKNFYVIQNIKSLDFEILMHLSLIDLHL